MCDIKLTSRQINVLKIIVEQYINTAAPISSKELVNISFKNLSSATIRNEMNNLEMLGLIEKTHTSSGRIPTTKGYKFYCSYILKPTLSIDLKHKLQKVFAKRLTSIETIINESMSIINKTLQLPSIVTQQEVNETLKRIDLIPINKNVAIILVVTSTGNITKNTITFNDTNILHDISICIKIFNDRLIDTPIEKLAEKIIAIKEIIKDSIENYEFVMQEMVTKIFNIKYQYHTEIYGTKYLTSQPEFNDVNKLNQILKLLDETNVWQHIAYNYAKNGKTTLITSEEKWGAKDLTIASINIKGKTSNHQISVVGPNRMNFSKVKGVLDFLKENIEKKYNGK